MDAGLSVSEAARRLACSEATVRRCIGADLVWVPDSSPGRVTAVSVEEKRRTLLRQLGVPDDSELSGLRDENLRLRQALNDLRMAQSLLLDAVGRFSQTAIPND